MLLSSPFWLMALASFCAVLLALSSSVPLQSRLLSVLQCLKRLQHTVNNLTVLTSVFGAPGSFASWSFKHW